MECFVSIRNLADAIGEKVPNIGLEGHIDNDEKEDQYGEGGDESKRHLNLSLSLNTIISNTFPNE